MTQGKGKHYKGRVRRGGTLKKKIHKYTYIKIKNFNIRRDHKENFRNKPQSGRYLLVQYMQLKKK